MSASPRLGVEELSEILAQIGERAYAEGRMVELSLYGGGAMLLCFQTGRMTRDVDAMFDRDKHWMWQVAAELARERGWPLDWLNDGVRRYLSDKDAESKTLRGIYPSPERPGLRVLTPSPAYLFAMKALALGARGESTDRDLHDLERLAEETGITSLDAALDLVASFYPHKAVTPRTIIALQDLFADAAPSPGQAGPCAEPSP